MKKCSRCVGIRDRNGRYCKACHAAYMRKWRKTHSPSHEQKIKSNARAYANVYKKRGKIGKGNCIYCGDSNTEMHHPDYSQPLNVIWLCRKCHLGIHNSSL